MNLTFDNHPNTTAFLQCQLNYFCLTWLPNLQTFSNQMSLCLVKLRELFYNHARWKKNSQWKFLIKNVVKTQF